MFAKNIVTTNLIYQIIIFIIFNVSLSTNGNSQAILKEGFVYLEDIIPNILFDLKYDSEDNFIGKCIDGYNNERLIISVEAARQLVKVQKELNQKKMSLYVYDAYRPQKAVNHFVRWAKDLKDTINKQQFYPNVEKNKLFAKGYISSHSRHSSGSTLDCTISDLLGNQLDMGSFFDYFGEISHVDYQKLTIDQKKNRSLLQSIMMKYGFRPYSEEWWHFTLRKEPYPNEYFNFEIN